MPLTFEELIKEVGNLKEGILKIVLWEDEKERRIKDVLSENPKVTGICFFVGPEGGFSPIEVDQLKRIGGVTIQLGDRILRTETAGITLLSIIQYEWGDLG